MPQPLLAVAAALVLLLFAAAAAHGFEIEEATVASIQLGFHNGSLTSVELVRFYLDRISRLNPLLHAVIEVNPDALRHAARADAERRSSSSGKCGALHGVPVLLKDNIATRDALNTTAGSFALLGSVARRDAGNPYVLSASPCGSSTGSAIAAAASMAAVTVGTETDGSILCPASLNSVVGIKPTVGLTSRAGVVPITPRQDTVGMASVVGEHGKSPSLDVSYGRPICRTVTDAVLVLDAIVGYDALDAAATSTASKYIPDGGYTQFLKKDGLNGKRIGIPNGFFSYANGTVQHTVYQQHIDTMRKQGAIVIEDLDIANLSVILDSLNNGQEIALAAEFKLSLNAYLPGLSYSPVRTLAEIIAFNDAHPVEEKMKKIGQIIFLVAENTTGIGAIEKAAISQLNKLSADGLEKLMREHELDAVVTPNDSASSVLAMGGMPAITIPGGYGKLGVPFGVSFGGLKGYEPRLIEMAYAFEQVTMVRKTPTFLP
ncbi:unnamed protein product [Triticum turgidum subsp. durum]|uniref:Amidase domain-containing protein n=1 Tax=Triticum turgidum subsp. durum TaxID=4567 RepID=A0A9R1NGT3_TRITD|nr:unnamed protein product [Triticum turgidum subsp. durum]